MEFERITIFSNLLGDLILSPRGSAGVSDIFHTSAAAAALLQEAQTAAEGAAAAAAARNTDAAPPFLAAADTPEALLPHRLPVEVSPLYQ